MVIYLKLFNILYIRFVSIYHTGIIGEDISNFNYYDIMVIEISSWISMYQKDILREYIFNSEIRIF